MLRYLPHRVTVYFSVSTALVRLRIVTTIARIVIIEQWKMLLNIIESNTYIYVQ